MARHRASGGRIRQWDILKGGVPLLPSAQVEFDLPSDPARNSLVDYADLKVLISEATAISKDLLHVHVALLLYLASVLVLGRNWRSLWPWLVVFLFELGNEAYDLWHQGAHNEAPRPAASLWDLWNTLLWPTALLLLARLGCFDSQAPEQPPRSLGDSVESAGSTGSWP
jgi:hypothetical protein